MKKSRHPHLAEAAFCVAMLLLCGVLAVYQYIWVGSLARAEAEQLRGNLRERGQQLSDDFSAELSQDFQSLKPAAEDLDRLGPEQAHANCWKQWLARHPRPIFSRVGVAIPYDGEVQLCLLDMKTGRLIAKNWPPEWESLHRDFQRKLRGGPPPPLSGNGSLFETPIHRQDGSESEWMMFELDVAYARETWLPRLILKDLSIGGQPLCGVTVFSEGAEIFAAPVEGKATTSQKIVISLNRRGPEPNGAPPRTPLWTLELQPKLDALDAIVATSRRRNLAIALALDGLILMSGLALLRHSRRSRRLAEKQMNFVATVSHELRTPLTVIRGAAHNLARGVVKEPEHVAHYARLVGEHAQQLQDVVEQVLEFAGTQADPAHASRTQQQIADVLRDALAASSHELQAANCKVELELATAMPLISADGHALRRAFQNLIGNAARHGGSGGWVGVSARAINGTHPPMVEVQVSDAGPGIPQSEHDAIFEPFVRGEAAREAQTRGSGIGLALVHAIIKSHGGSIHLSSAPGNGACFTVRLPAV